jgi:hypothetical protein
MNTAPFLPQAIAQRIIVIQTALLLKRAVSLKPQLLVISPDNYCLQDAYYLQASI